MPDLFEDLRSALQVDRYRHPAVWSVHRAVTVDAEAQGGWNASQGARTAYRQQLATLLPWHAKCSMGAGSGQAHVLSINPLLSVVLGPAAERVAVVLQAAHEGPQGLKPNRVTCTSDGDAVKAVSRRPVGVRST